MLTLFSLLLVKHFIADFLLQPKWMWSNKGTFLHPGGLAHSAFHACLTFLILGFWDIYTAYALASGEFCAHYFIDYYKININAKFGWTCNNSEKFWWFLGLDQLLHQGCYIFIVWWMMNG